MQHDTRNGGYIALITVLIVGAAATAISLVLLVTGADSQRAALVEQQSIQARSLASACAEEALQVVHDNKAYTGTNTITLSTGTCSYTVTSTGTSTRTIDTSATVDEAIRKVKVLITIGATNISINSWQEVS